jgi:hypothetical protein
VLSAFFNLAATAPSVSADTSTKKSTNFTKGQSQLAGGNGEFGVVYSMKDGWNEEILSAQYVLDAFVGSSDIFPASDQKVFLLSVALKNATPKPQWFNNSGRYTVCDQTGKQFTSFAEGLASAGHGTFQPTLNPGQGLGQPSLNDPVRIAFLVDGKSRITKLLINEPRLGRNEQLVRYFLKGATAAEDGGDGDPKNVVAPLPPSAQDTSDPTGAIALAVGNGGKPGAGTTCATRFFEFTVDSFGDAPAGTTVGGSQPDANMKFVQAFVTVHNFTADSQEPYWLQFAGTHELTDSDGDTYKLDKCLKVSSDSETGNEIQPAGFLKWRYVFEVPVNAKLQTLKIGSYQARLWNFDISGG